MGEESKGGLRGTQGGVLEKGKGKKISNRNSKGDLSQIQRGNFGKRFRRD
jgi:hypothetical protein